MGDLLRCNLTRLILESLMIIPRSNKILKQMSLSLRDSNAIVNMFMCYFFCSNQSEAHCHIDKIPILWPFFNRMSHSSNGIDIAILFLSSVSEIGETKHIRK